MSAETVPTPTPAAKADDFEPYDDADDTVLAPPPPPPAAAAKPAETPKHDEFALSMARELGATQSQIDAMSPDELRGAIKYTLAQRKNQPAQAVEPAKPVVPAEEEFDFGLSKERLAEFDPDFYTAMKALAKKAKLADAAHEEVKKLKTEYETEKTERTKRQLYGQADKVFSAREDVFGKGAPTDLTDPAQLARRRAAFNMAMGPDADQGVPFPKRLQQAAETLFGPAKPAEPVAPAKKATPADDYLEQAKAAWAAGTVAKPTAAKPVEVKEGTWAAVEAEAKKVMKPGSYWESDGSDPLDGIPD